jgi:hypothetical protein
MNKEIELLFELDYGFHQAYRVQLKNGLINYEDDAETDYMPMTGMWFECGQRNGVYNT